ncbi:acyl-CoA dehydrogenase family protein [Subtercola lobariae]|uniref:Acyl-CoA dehydrogenase n=1 Tax=Subtercola lobariae TaxID=1588641 RepID=A0A917B599_9MICO|nr:acyl-CoA dehydrogenase family protein [Subtercola lobariae]GGF21440.1 acyl-CoA dehydrogenase [Subtercola lobariae]
MTILDANPEAATETAAVAQTLKERAVSLAGLIKEHAVETEDNRRVAEPVIEALNEAGLFKLAQPKRLGGNEVSVRDFVEINSLIARADGATGWVTTLINVCGWMTGTFPERAQNDVWGDNPDARVCGVLTPTATATYEEGGLRITGAWGFASGSLHSQWALLGLPIVNDQGAQIDQGLALVPMSDLTIDDTWYVAGMRGTGSNTLVATDVFIPDYRIISISKAIEGEYGTEHTDEVLYRSAFVSTLSIVLAGAMTGMARGALEYVLGSLAKGKGIAYTFYDNSVNSGSTQINMAEAAELVDTAMLHMARCADNIDQAARDGVYLTLIERGRARMDTGYIARKTREAVDLLMSVQGAGGFAEVSPLQRYWRDLNTASRHAVVSPGISSETYGRVLLGVKEQITPLI